MRAAAPGAASRQAAREIGSKSRIAPSRLRARSPGRLDRQLSAISRRRRHPDRTTRRLRPRTTMPARPTPDSSRRTRGRSRRGGRVSAGVRPTGVARATSRLSPHRRPATETFSQISLHAGATMRRERAFDLYVSLRRRVSPAVPRAALRVPELREQSGPPAGRRARPTNSGFGATDASGRSTPRSS